MATAGPNNPSAATGNTGAGVSWSNPTNVYSSNDSRATNNLFGGGNSKILLATGFGFAIPSGATIDGILLEIERSGQILNVIKDFSVRLTKAGTAVGDNVADTSIFWPTTDTYKTYGGATSLFGTTWSDSEINDSGFGVALVVSTASAKGWSAKVDHFRITVYYTAGGGGGGGGTANNLLLLGVG